VINLLATQVASLPQGAKSDVAPKLPWPNGSIITAKLSPSDHEGSVILSLGAYRMQAKVPPNTPMGQVWLQLINRSMPAQFRLLTDATALRLVAENLAKPEQKDGRLDGLHRQGLDAWQKMDSDNLPFRMDIASHGRHVMLHNGEDEDTQGMVCQQQSDDSFMLHGRVDLPALGAIAFALKGDDSADWKLRVYVENHQVLHALLNDFSTWLAAKNAPNKEQEARNLDASICVGLPESLDTV